MLRPPTGSALAAIRAVLPATPVLAGRVVRPRVGEVESEPRADRHPRARINAGRWGATWDMGGAALAVWLAAWLVPPPGAGSAHALAAAAAAGGFSLPALSLVGAQGHTAVGGPGLARIALAATLCTWGAWAAVRVAGREAGGAELSLVWAALVAVWLGGRAVLARSAARERVLVVGSGEVAGRLARLVRRDHGRRLDLVGYVDDEPDPELGSTIPYAGCLAALPALVRGGAADRLLVAFSSRGDRAILDALRACDGAEVRIDAVPRLFDLLGPGVRGYALGAFPVVSAGGESPSPTGRALKRAVDVAGAAVLLGLVAPLLALIAVAIALVDGRPVLFRQVRVGRGGRPFTILKFRTMRDGSDGVAEIRQLFECQGEIARVVADVKAKGAASTTRTGPLLRRLSLDELPQLVNVLRGDMSLVGPRPLRAFESNALAAWQRAREDVRPGISGLWQVLGRSEIAWDERMQLDWVYARHWSLESDAWILARTLPSVLKGRGAL